MQPLGEMIIERFSPGIVCMAANTPVKYFLGNPLLSAGKLVDWLVDAVVMTVGTGGQIFYVLFGIFRGSFAVYADLIFFDHARMGKWPAGRGISEMAGGCTVHLFNLSMGELFYAKVAFATADFPMDGLIIKLLVYIKEMLLSYFINSSQTGVPMAQKTVFLINSKRRTSEEENQNKI
jgi:hypothetical protein